MLGASTEGVVAHPAGDHLAPKISPDEIARRAHQETPLRLLFVGNLIPRKGLHVLLCAMASIPEVPCTLTIVGGDHLDLAYARSTRQMANQKGLKGRVVFRGELPELALRAAMRIHHLLVMPSIYEGFGIVYLEAMGFGMPPIGSRSGGAQEIVTEDEDGFLIAPGDQNALAGVIAALEGDRDRLAALGIAARARYERHPTWQETGRRIRSFLQTVQAYRGR
jgi:glycosyltransferase involved in cell wall biosynthesis